MSFTVSGITFFLGLAIAAAKNPGTYSKSHYIGPSHNAVIALYYRNNYRQPKCYGAMINFMVVMAPCSCVTKEPNKQDLATWWDHRNKKAVQVDTPANYKALVMHYEQQTDSVKNKLSSEVTKIDMHPKCDTLFQYNVARLELARPIEGTKLAWVPRAIPIQMKRLLKYGNIGTAMREACHVYRWKVYSEDWNTKANDQPPKPQLFEHEVSLTKWSTCKSLVCAKTSVKAPFNAAKFQDEKVCNNEFTGARHCAEWDVNLPFCNVIPGTPVFCKVGALAGLIGFVHNATQFCPMHGAHKFAVMEGIDLALPLIKCDMRSINVMFRKPKC